MGALYDVGHSSLFVLRAHLKMACVLLVCIYGCRVQYRRQQTLDELYQPHAVISVLIWTQQQFATRRFAKTRLPDVR